MKKLISWNVNGIRAAETKGLFDFLHREAPDLLALQETKASPDQLSASFLSQKGYEVYFASAEKKGYSGVAVYTRLHPLSVSLLGDARFDSEGRTLILEFDDFFLLNCYFPNSQEGGKRLPYKLAFNEAVLTKCNALLQSGKHIVLCGDYNVAHRPIDLANPERNEGNPGYLPEERAWMDAFLAAGYTDTFRLFNGEAGQYSWWSYRFQAREKNIGWRIDYFCVDGAFQNRVESASILATVMGSDHCPISLLLK